MSTQSYPILDPNDINRHPTESLIQSTGVIKKSKIPNHYLVNERIDCLIHEEIKIADNLENYLIESLIHDIFYTNSYITRVSAMQQLNSFIDQDKIRRIFKIIAKNEKNPQLREFASKLLGVTLS